MFVCVNCVSRLLLSSLCARINKRITPLNSTKDFWLQVFKHYLLFLGYFWMETLSLEEKNQIDTDDFEGTGSDRAAKVDQFRH